MKAAVKQILKGISKVTDICTEILCYNSYKRGFSVRESRKNVQKWSKDLRRFTKKIKASNRKYMHDVEKLKHNLDSTILQSEVYDFFTDVTTSLVLYVRKLIKSVRPFLIFLKNGRDYLLMESAPRLDLLKSMRVFKSSIMMVMENFFRIIDRTRELELSVFHSRLAAASKATNTTTNTDASTNVSPTRPKSRSSSPSGRPLSPTFS